MQVVPGFFKKKYIFLLLQILPAGRGPARLQLAVHEGDGGRGQRVDRVAGGSAVRKLLKRINLCFNLCEIDGFAVSAEIGLAATPPSPPPSPGSSGRRTWTRST